MSVKLLRLTTGEMLLADTTILHEQGMYTLKKPAWIAQVKAGEFALVPWLPLAKDDVVTLSADKIIYCLEPETGIANEYSTGFGSGLVMPNGGVKPVNLKLSEE
jgi:hypothetical protein